MFSQYFFQGLEEGLSKQAFEGAGSDNGLTDFLYQKSLDMRGVLPWSLTDNAVTRFGESIGDSLAIGAGRAGLFKNYKSMKAAQEKALKALSKNNLKTHK